MSFEVLFTVATAVVAAGFVAVVGLVVHRAIRSSRDPEYRAHLEAQARARARRGGMDDSMRPGPDPIPSDPFPGGPANPF